MDCSNCDGEGHVWDEEWEEDAICDWCAGSGVDENE